MTPRPHPAPRVLVVEDDENLRLALADNLEQDGLSVRVAARAAEARSELITSRFELVVLDLMLPDGDGYTLCREVRAGAPETRILMLTARSLEEDLVRGFDAGADDYLTKPYRLRELLARVRALLRRSSGPAVETLVFAGFRLDLAARTLSGPAGLIDLTRTELELLATFVRHRDRALTRDQLLDAVWGPDVVVDTRTIDNFVSSLKKKLGWSGGAPWRIKALRGVGYRLEIEDDPRPSSAASAGPDGG